MNRESRIGHRAVVLIACVLALMVALLRSFGRVWWCACGDLRLYATEVLSSHNSQHLLDAYSFTHVSHGLVFYALLWKLLGRQPVPLRLVVAVSIEAVWEVLENSSLIIERYRAATVSLNYYGDSVLNSLGDIGCCMLGFWIAARLPWRRSLGLFVVSELALLLFIRDNLTLNILMLLWPIAAIKTWQSG